MAMAHVAAWRWPGAQCTWRRRAKGRKERCGGWRGGRKVVRRTNTHVAWDGRAQASLVGKGGSWEAVQAPKKLLEKVQARMQGLWRKLVPMAFLFFFMSFVNSILDSTKDTLVVTAFGGAEQLPFLTVYAVLPCSLLFLMVYSKMANRLEPGALFYATLVPFVAFFGLFGTVLFPFQHILHPNTETWLRILPAGLEGGVAMIQHWTYTLFYVFSELWGDVVLSLLFWGLANETTNVDEARVIYPLFGIGANVAQAMAGRVLKWLADGAHGSSGLSATDAWASQLKAMMAIVVVSGFCIMALHGYIRKALIQVERKNSSGQPMLRKKSNLSIGESFHAIVSSKQIRCLAAMAVAQGLASILFQVTWKGQIRILHPQPTEYSSFMGDVATASGLFTGLSMLAAPMLFTKLGWSGAAQFTPYVMVFGGWIFFSVAIWANNGGLATCPHLLGPMVAGGAALYIFEKAAKFSLFKPAEEMVYIGLDEDKRTKGKAAVDVVGAQFGKSSGSVFQQGLLVGMGTLSRALPIILLTHSLVIAIWIMAIDALAHHHGHLLTFDEEESDTNDLVCELEDRPVGDRIVEA